STKPSQGTPMRSSGEKRFAPLPRSATWPTTMCAITSGSFGSANSPLTMWRSVRHTAQTEIRIRICRSPGEGTGRSTSCRGALAARSCIAFMSPHPDPPPQAGEGGLPAYPTRCEGNSVRSLSGDPALERGREADLGGGEGPGDGTGLLGVLGDAFEGRLIDAGHAALRAQLDLGDGPPFVDLVEVHSGRGADFLRRMAGLREGVSERHRKTTGFRRADQLFGVGTGAVLHPAGEAIASFEG